MLEHDSKPWVNYDAHLEGRQGADPSLASFALRLSAFPAELVNTDSTDGSSPAQVGGK